MTVATFTLQENVLIKETLPRAGVVSSNPQRSKRMVETCLKDAELHTNSWGVVIYVGRYLGQKMFISSVPMGGGGSGFAFLEMYAAGAEYIVRYGSNDRFITQDNLKDIIIVDEADNLYGLMRDSGAPESEWGRSLYASSMLTETLINKASTLGYPVKRMICHHVEDYHAYNYPELTSENYEEIQKIIQRVENRSKKSSAWDMETAALFWRSKQFCKHAITVLQSLIKKKGLTRPYEGRHGEIAIHMEKVFYKLIFECLYEVLQRG